jgi:formamidopyrimidine-DNA glycosylase
MPEGHTIHRAARLQTKRFGGHEVEVWSPQGRFSEGAAVLTGHEMDRVDALGKHLLYRWVDAPTLHVHLGLFGRFKIGKSIEPSPNARLAWRSGAGMLALSGPTVCELFDDDDESDLRSRIGPDPLAPRDDDLERFRSALSRRTIPIGAAMLDQKVVAGVGNVYRAEILHLVGLDPRTESRRLDEGDVAAIWKETRSELARGERIGRIVTVEPSAAGVTAWKDIPRGERLHVYKRKNQPCRTCGTAIDSVEMAGRSIWWCPECQPKRLRSRR